MIRLNPNNINTPELSEDIFKNIWHSKPHSEDQDRFDELAKYFTKGRYIDLGCFNSPKPGQLAENPVNEIWGIDHAEKVIAEMSKIYPKVNYIADTFTRIPMPSQYFNYVVAGEVIEHLEEPAAFIKEAIRVLKKDGILAISTPWEEGIKQTIVTTEHVWSYSIQDIKDLLSPYGDVFDLHIFEGSFKVIMAYVRKI
jgi:2-polyprenyl-3-methyl-5-hydroxy-6-metoxy-1,4-benzoquinol methylase